MIRTPPQTVISSQRSPGMGEVPAACREEHRVVPRHDADEQNAAERRQRALATPIQIRRAKRGQRVEAEDHALALNHEVQKQTNEEQRQEDPQLLVHLFDAS